MRAAVLHEVGGPLVVEELPDPVPGPGEVLVDITHASVNPLDIWVSRGVPGAAATNLPWIPGTEAAGLHTGLPVLVRGGSRASEEEILRAVAGSVCGRATGTRDADEAAPMADG